VTLEISVYIQTYQHARYIEQAIEGVLGQQGSFDLELVIADDCSTDGTRELLAGYRDRDPHRIRLLLPEHNLGATEIFRRSIRELRGKYVAWLDGDDYWTDERKLEKQLDAMRRNPAWAACFHNASIFQEGSDAPPRPYVLDIAGDSITFGDLLRTNIVPSLSTMARGELVRELPDWVWNGRWADWRAMLAIAMHGEIGYLPESMGVYRSHREGLSTGLSRAGQLEEDLRFFTTLEDVVDEQYLATIAKTIRERHCQLVVERQEVPFSGVVAVLGPRAETPTDLNGRLVWPLAIEDEELEAIDGRDRDGSLAKQLERFRLAAPEAEPGLAHFEDGDRVPEPNGEPALRLLVVGPMLEWLDRHSRLGRQLEGHCTTLWQDEVCALREVSFAADAPLPMGARAEVVEVTPPTESEHLFGSHLDLPLAGESTDAHSLEIAGWAIGESSPAVAVEAAHGEDLLASVPVDQPRPDLEQAFPEQTGIGRSGFSMVVSLVGSDPSTPIEVRAVLEDGTRALIACIDWSRSWRSAGDGAEAPLVSVIAPAAASQGALASVRAQTYAKLEVVATAEAASGDMHILLDPEEQLPPRTLEQRVAARLGTPGDV
jgi:glycosyltransferase involved in cell wall biosynthesis